MNRRDQLAAHRAQLVGCRRCEHHQHIVPILSLAVSPRVMLVGQAPGCVEAEGGMPHIAPLVAPRLRAREVAS